MNDSELIGKLRAELADAEKRISILEAELDKLTKEIAETTESDPEYDEGPRWP